MKAKLIRSIALLLMMTCHTTYADYHSQVGQDRFVNETFFKDKHNGVFLDIGAYDGIHISNTYFFENEREWTGICIEPQPRSYAQLKNNRSSLCVNCAIGQENGFSHFLEIESAEFPDLAMLSGIRKFFNEEQIKKLRERIAPYHGTLEVKQIPVRNLNELLIENNIFHIDFLSIDVEGGELDILSSIDFNTFYIQVMTVENNDREANPKIQQFLESKGFRFVTRLEQDEIYENNLVQIH